MSEEIYSQEWLAQLWEDPAGVVIGGREMSFAFSIFDKPEKALMQVKFFPRQRLAVCRVDREREPTVSFEPVAIPEDIKTGDKLILFVLKSSIGPEMGFGYELSEALEKQLDQLLRE